MTIIVTRHEPLVAYAREIGLVGEDVRVLAHVSADDVRGQHVVGVLPLHLAALASSVTEIPLALTPSDREAMQRGDLPIERLREIAGAPTTYRVRRIS